MVASSCFERASDVNFLKSTQEVDLCQGLWSVMTACVIKLPMHIFVGKGLIIATTRNICNGSQKAAQWGEAHATHIASDGGLLAWFIMVRTKTVNEFT